MTNPKTDMRDDIKEVVVSEQEIKAENKRLAAKISSHYDDGEEVIMVGILRGAVIFMADLAREIDSPVIFDFMDVSSYGKDAYTSGNVRIIKDLEENIEGKHVLIVEDIIDTGLTMKRVVNLLQTRDPASIKIVTLLDKPERRVQKKVQVDYNGFEVPDEFVVGYGLDYAEKYRNLPFIGALKEHLYS